MDMLHLKNIASKSLEFTNLTFVKTSGTKLTNIWADIFLVSLIRHFQLQHDGNVLLCIHGVKSQKFLRSTQNSKTNLYESEFRCSSYQVECYLRKLTEQGKDIKLVVISDFMILNDGDFQSTIDDFERLSKEYGCHFILREVFAFDREWNYNTYQVHKINLSKRSKFSQALQELNLFEIKCSSLTDDGQSCLSIYDSYLHFPECLIPYLE